MKKAVPVLCVLSLTATLLGRLQAPDPSAFLGFSPGADRQLAGWQAITGYFQLLGRHSRRVQVEELGRTTGDRPFLLLIISDPGNLAQLEKLRQIQAELADPRLSLRPLEDLIREGKTVVLMTCSIHSTEVASTLMSVELAHRLATREDRETEAILRNVVLLLVPSLNPDGVDLVADWYRETLGTPAEGTHPPRLYHPYVGHDNNRDWFMSTQKETRLVVEKIHNRWHPQIVVDVHQMEPYGARLFVPPYVDPIDPNVDPILQAGILQLGGAVFAALLSEEKQGVVTHALYDAWSPARSYQHYHGGVRLLVEAASARLATPIEVQAGQLRATADFDPHRRRWNFPLPWAGGPWRLRDIMDYETLALRAALVHASRYREWWLRSFHRVGLRALRRQQPYAFVLPPDQHDTQNLYDLLQLLQRGQVDIFRARAPFGVDFAQPVSAPLGTAGRRQFPAGSWVIPMQQPYSAFAKTLLEVQHYPELRARAGGPLRPPYDVAGHTLGIQMGVEGYQIDSPFPADLAAAGGITTPDGELRGEGNYWLFSHASTAFARLSNRLLKKGHPVYWAPNGFRLGEEGFEAGTLMARVPVEAEVRALLKEIPVEIRRVPQVPQLAWRRIDLPRVGLYRNHAPAMDEGWTRWILEEHEFPYQSLRDEDIRSGSLDRFDVIIIPHQTLELLKNGLEEPYPDVYRGGLGEEGLSRLRQFTEQGGTLLLLGQATEAAFGEWRVPLRLPTRNLSPEQFLIPGSLIRVQVNNRHPIGYGMPREAAVMFLHSPVLEAVPGVSVARYAESGILLSGWASGEDRLAGKTALAEVRLGRGRLILIGFRTQFRAQTRGTFKFLFNSLYYATMK